MDIYIKKAIIHQFSPDDTELFLADKFLNITPKIEEYLRKKVERVYSDDAKTGIFEEDNPFFNQMVLATLKIDHQGFVSTRSKSRQVILS